MGLALAPACDVPREPEPAQVRAAEPASPLASPSSRGRLLAGERVERVPAWPDAAAVDTRVRERLPTATLAAVDRAPVPVLAPSDPEWATPTIATPAAGYALSTRGDGRTLVVQASREARLVPGIGRHEGRDRLRGAAGYVTDNDGVKSASWIEAGAAYSVDLECDDVASPGCSVEALRAEVERLVLVGGVGVGATPSSSVGGAP